MKNKILILLLLSLSWVAKAQDNDSTHIGFVNETWAFSESQFQFVNYYFLTDSTFIRENIYSGGMYHVNTIEGKYKYDNMTGMMYFNIDGASPYKVTFVGDTAVSLVSTAGNMTEIKPSLISARTGIFGGESVRLKNVLYPQKWDYSDNLVNYRFDFDCPGNNRAFEYSFTNPSLTFRLRGTYYYSNERLYLSFDKEQNDYKWHDLPTPFEVQLPIKIMNDTVVAVHNIQAIANILSDPSQQHITGYADGEIERTIPVAPLSGNEVLIMRRKTRRYK